MEFHVDLLVDQRLGIGVKVGSNLGGRHTSKVPNATSLFLIQYVVTVRPASEM